MYVCQYLFRVCCTFVSIYAVSVVRLSVFISCLLYVCQYLFRVCCTFVSIYFVSIVRLSVFISCLLYVFQYLFRVCCTFVSIYFVSVVRLSVFMPCLLYVCQYLCRVCPIQYINLLCIVITLFLNGLIIYNEIWYTSVVVHFIYCFIDQVEPFNVVHTSCLFPTTNKINIILKINRYIPSLISNGCLYPLIFLLQHVFLVVWHWATWWRLFQRCVVCSS